MLLPTATRQKTRMADSLPFSLRPRHWVCCSYPNCALKGRGTVTEESRISINAHGRGFKFAGLASQARCAEPNSGARIRRLRIEPQVAGLQLTSPDEKLTRREEARMADPWTQVGEDGNPQEGGGAKWIITRSFALALVVLLALFALRTS